MVKVLSNACGSPAAVANQLHACYLDRSGSMSDSSQARDAIVRAI
jgi:hypothetical protein